MRNHDTDAAQRGGTNLIQAGKMIVRSSLIVISFALFAGTAQAGLPRTPESAVTPEGGAYGRILARVKEGPVGILFLGDSITENWPNTSKSTWSKLEPYHPADFGIGGIETGRLLWCITSFGELDRISPKVVVIMIGTNNIGHNPDETPEWAAAGIKKVVETVHEKLPRAKVLLLGILPRAETKEIAGIAAVAKVAQVNAIIKGLDDGKNITYLDLGGNFLDPQGKAIKELYFDGLHPNSKGYDVWFNAMWPILEPMLK